MVDVWSENRTKDLEMLFAVAHMRVKAADADDAIARLTPPADAIHARPGLPRKHTSPCTLGHIVVRNDGLHGANNLARQSHAKRPLVVGEIALVFFHVKQSAAAPSAIEQHDEKVVRLQDADVCVIDQLTMSSTERKVDAWLMSESADSF